jgi:tRNA(Arg) A34 adenosine deaminase TadA
VGAALIADPRAFGAPVALEADDPLALVQGVWAAHPERAHLLLRRPIFTTLPDGPFLRGLTRVCARRLRAGLSADALEALVAAAPARRRLLAPPPPPPPWTPADPPAPPAADRDGLAAWLRALAPAGDGPLRHRDRPVAAALLDGDGRVAWAARNTGGRDRSRHAELNLIQSWAGPLPAGARVLVGLQPCRMCAGLLAERGLREVRWLDPDPGPLARGTALDSGSPERAGLDGPPGPWSWAW